MKMIAGTRADADMTMTAIGSAIHEMIAIEIPITDVVTMTGTGIMARTIVDLRMSVIVRLVSATTMSDKGIVIRTAHWILQPTRVHRRMHRVTSSINHSVPPLPLRPNQFTRLAMRSCVLVVLPALSRWIFPVQMKASRPRPYLRSMRAIIAWLVVLQTRVRMEINSSSEICLCPDLPPPSLRDQVCRYRITRTYPWTRMLKLLQLLHLPSEITLRSSRIAIDQRLRSQPKACMSTRC